MLLKHAFGLFTHPDAEWATIRKEHETPAHLYVSYVLILAAIGPICAYISTTYFGWTVGSERLIKLSNISAIQLSVLTYIAILVGVFAMGYAIDWMAKTYGSTSEADKSNGMALAAYASTPLFLAGFALLYPVPWFNGLVFLAAAAYAGYLIYDGLPIVLGIPKEQAVVYCGAVLTVALVILVCTRIGSVLIWNIGFAPQYVG
ncbi:Yip1 family protein [Marinobacter sp. BGYM27]|uniref:Yip1 family protein n=1 Tax=unclassified Marinobacter TaxID=83889 RepID=UPI0021A395B1|nr:Yip1 family protein [Marinobacter sp. BGYM27]MDG5501049.1 Yip1 family protein [Marinobacter sp. BGYM27]